MKNQSQEYDTPIQLKTIRKMALDGIRIRLDLKDVRQLTVMLRRRSDNLYQNS